MPSRILDLSKLQYERTYECQGTGEIIHLEDFIDGLKPAVDALARAGYVKKKDSFGITIARPEWNNRRDDGPSKSWDNPEQFAWCVGGWGPDRDLYIANTIGKMRALLREGAESTLALRFQGFDGWQDIIDTKGLKKDFPFGDFPYGGAVRLQMGPLTVRVAISTFTEMEDHATSLGAAGLLGAKILAGEGLPYPR